MKKSKLYGLALIFLAAQAFAVDVTGTGGWSSEYIFRGVPQSDSSAFASLDAEQDGLYAGAWAGDVMQGLEIDYYAGYTGEYEELDYGIGVTWYTYTDKFDDDYIELNLSGGWEFLTVDVAIGEYKNFDGPTQDYTFVSITAEYNNFYALFGNFSRDFDGQYVEAGYGNTLSVQGTELFDYAFSVIYSDEDLLGPPTGDPMGAPQDDFSFVLTLSKSFDLFSN